MATTKRQTRTRPTIPPIPPQPEGSEAVTPPPPPGEAAASPGPVLEKYPFLQAYARFTKMSDENRAEQLARAIEEDAPNDVVFRNHDDWVHIDQVFEPFQSQLRALA